MNAANTRARISIIRRILATTALGAGLIAAGPALADNSWTGFTPQEGSITTTTAGVHTTNITQNTNFAKVRGNADIYAGDTVNLTQNSNRAKFVVYDVKGDATKIQGNLNANGQVYIFNQDGVIFGANSHVNVGSIVASTGTISDANIKADKLVFDNVGAGGDITLKGQITVADAGLAAFVAPGIENSGTIIAKMGTVVLASGDKVTIDMYGDNLVNVTVDGKLSNALIKNSGTIRAEGGNIVLSAAAAKKAVDNVINMSGVADVSSVTVKGGKIVLSAAGTGRVKVSGSLDASGKRGGGTIAVRGQNIDAVDTSTFTADAFGKGNGGSVKLIARNDVSFDGAISARGGDIKGDGGTAEISGQNGFGYDGSTDLSATDGTMGMLTLDPAHLTIYSDDYNSNDGFGISARALANSMENSNVTLSATDYIDVGTKTTEGEGDGSIDLSTYFGNIVIDFPETLRSAVQAFGISIPYSGVTEGSLTLNSNVINFNKDLIMGYGNVNVAAPTVNLNGKLMSDTSGGGEGFPIFDLFSLLALPGDQPALLGDDRISSTAGIVNVLSPAALIQQGIYLTSDNGGTVNVAAGTYNEDLTIDRKNVTLNGAQKGVLGYAAARGLNETILTPHSPGIVVTGNGTVIDGLTIDGASDGAIVVDGADNVTVQNNVITNNSDNGIVFKNGANSGSALRNFVTKSGIHGITFANSDDAIVKTNKVDQTGSTGIDVLNGTNARVLENRVDNTGDDGIHLYNVGGVIGVNDNRVGGDRGSTILGNGIYLYNSNGAVIKRNRVSNTVQTAGIDHASGIYVQHSNNVTVGGSTTAGEDATYVDGNIIRNADWDGIKVADSVGSTVQGNDIAGVVRVGVYGESAEDFSVLNNTIFDSSAVNYGGIAILGGGGFKNVSRNFVYGDATSADRAGIYLGYVNAGQITVTENYVHDLNGMGILAERSSNVDINNNLVLRTGNDGIALLNDGGTLNVSGNVIGDSESFINGNGIYVDHGNGAVIARNTVINTKQGPGIDHASGIYINASDNVLVGGDSYADANTVTNNQWDGIKVVGGTGSTVSHNRTNNSTRVGVYGEGANNLTIDNNIVFNSQAVNWGGISVVGGTTHTIDNNEVSDIPLDLLHNGIFLLATGGTDTVTNNYLHDLNGDGIHAQTVGDLVIDTNTITNVENNGIQLNDFNTATVNGNIQSNAVLRGLYVSGGDNGTISVAGNSFTNNDIGMEFESGLIDLTGASNTITGGRVGIRFSPVLIDLPVFEAKLADDIFFPLVPSFFYSKLALVDDDKGVTTQFPNPPTNFGGTLGNQIFSGQSQYYVELANGAFFEPGEPTYLNGLNSSYDGLRPSDTGGIVSAASLATLEDRFFHYIDDQSLGLFYFGTAPATAAAAADINQNQVFNNFGAFNGDLTGFNVRITGLPSIPGGGNPVNFAAISPAAGGNGPANRNFASASDLNDIATAAGGGGSAQPDQSSNTTQAVNGQLATGNTAADQATPQTLGDIETAAGGNDNTSCWGTAVNAAANGQAVNVVYQGSINDNLTTASNCGTSF